MVSRFILLGSGGGGRTAASILEAWSLEQGGGMPDIAFLDDADKRSQVNDYPVLGPVARALDGSDWPATTGFVVTYGSTHLAARQRVFDCLVAKGRNVVNAIHPRAVIDRCSKLGVGNVIAANCVVHPNARVGNNCFICVASTIDHDDQIGDNVYFSPGVHLAGAVTVEDNVFIGTNAVVLPGVRIRKRAVIGAGAVVLRDVAPGVTVVGMPARIVTKATAGSGS